MCSEKKAKTPNNNNNDRRRRTKEKMKTKMIEKNTQTKSRVHFGKEKWKNSHVCYSTQKFKFILIRSMAQIIMCNITLYVGNGMAYHYIQNVYGLQLNVLQWNDLIGGFFPSSCVCMWLSFIRIIFFSCVFISLTVTTLRYTIYIFVVQQTYCLLPLLSIESIDSIYCSVHFLKWG